METKVLVVAVVENNGKVLMRKKPEGSPPYNETWYIFGATVTAETPVDESIKQEVRTKAGVDIAITYKATWDTEIKNDLDGVRKFFVYLDVVCEYMGGELVAGDGVERLEWVVKSELCNYDIVPPSRVLFEKLGYIK